MPPCVSPQILVFSWSDHLRLGVDLVPSQTQENAQTWQVMAEDVEHAAAAEKRPGKLSRKRNSMTRISREWGEEAES